MSLSIDYKEIVLTTAQDCAALCKELATYSVLGVALPGISDKLLDVAHQLNEIDSMGILSAITPLSDAITQLQNFIIHVEITDNNIPHIQQLLDILPRIQSLTLKIANTKETMSFFTSNLLTYILPSFLNETNLKTKTPHAGKAIARNIDAMIIFLKWKKKVHQGSVPETKELLKQIEETLKVVDDTKEAAHILYACHTQILSATAKALYAHPSTQCKKEIPDIVSRISHYQKKILDKKSEFEKQLNQDKIIQTNNVIMQDQYDACLRYEKNLDLSAHEPITVIETDPAILDLRKEMIEALDHILLNHECIPELGTMDPLDEIQLLRNKFHKKSDLSIEDCTTFLTDVKKAATDIKKACPSLAAAWLVYIQEFINYITECYGFHVKRSAPTALLVISWRVNTYESKVEHLAETQQQRRSSATMSLRSSTMHGAS